MKLYSRTLYHGTPHDFDYFDTEHIGIGEGHQVHGWGLYFAENKDIAVKRYGKRLSKKNSKISLKVDGNEYIFDDVMFWYDDCRENYPEIPVLFTSYADLYGIDNPTDVVLEHLEDTLANNQEKDPDEELYIAELCKYKDSVTRQEFMDELQKAIDFINSHDISLTITKGTGTVFTVNVPDDLMFIDENDYVNEDVIESLGFSTSKDIEKEIAEKVHEKFIQYINKNEIEIKNKIALERVCDAIAYDMLHSNLRTKWTNIEYDITQMGFEFARVNWNPLINELMSITPENNNFMGVEKGKNFYSTLSHKLGSPRNASLFLEENGINGITYDGNQDGRCYVIFNPDNIDIIKKEKV